MALCGIRSPRPEPVLGLVPRTAWQEVAREGQRGLRCCPELAPPDGPTQSLEAGWILTITEGEDSRSALTSEKSGRAYGHFSWSTFWGQTEMVVASKADWDTFF